MRLCAKWQNTHSALKYTAYFGLPTLSLNMVYYLRNMFVAALRNGKRIHSFACLTDKLRHASRIGERDNQPP
ncbi:hypothetical protein LCM4573_26720 [Rhizobium sp. LCM 4573]|nr:hypothetical protein LCM4573_26720 [Rhizobium sp. LCM 4573]